MFEAGERPQGKVSASGFEDGEGHVVSNMGACGAQSSHQLTASKEKGDLSHTSYKNDIVPTT